jgi:glutamyl-tRNA synthetase
MPDDAQSIIRKHALRNALDYGKADLNAVMGKAMGESPELRKDAAGAMQKAIAIIGEINGMPKEEMEKELANYTFAKAEKKEHRFTMPNPQDGIITRFAPEPSGYPHIGHAKAIFLEYEVAKDYRGSMRLRFDDTNPKKEKQEYVEAFKDALDWLGVEWKGESYTSDNMGKFYAIAKKFLERGLLYVTTASNDEIREARGNGTTIKGRDNAPEKNLELWDRMMSNAFSEGEIVVLLKSDLKALNSVMRDPAMFRIVEGGHYRQGSKYAVWPTYDFEAPLMDSMEGITHAMRSKEYELREELYFKILDLAEMRKPTLIHFSRLDIKNSVISKRHLVPLVESGKVWGWDDPRLPTISGLRARGICPEAIRNFALRFGIGKQEKEVDWDFLLMENRQALDKVAKHMFFVREPVLVKLKGAFPESADIPMHPSVEMGNRHLGIGKAAYIEKADWDAINDGEVFRLKDYASAKADKKGMALEFMDIKEHPKLRIHWVGEKGAVKAKLYVVGNLLNEDDSFNEKSIEALDGVCEKSAETLKEGEIVQFERVGYSRLRSKERMEFVLSEQGAG